MTDSDSASQNLDEKRSAFDSSATAGSESDASTGFETNAAPSFVTGLFYDRESAENAYDSLLRRGYLPDDITLLMADETRNRYFGGDDSESELGSKALEGAGSSSAVGGTLGAIIGGVAAVGTNVLLPGLGLVVAGPLASSVAGAGAGGLTGGLVGVLIGSGIPEERALQYEEGIRNGGLVMGVYLRNKEDADYYENEIRSRRGENIYSHHGGEISNTSEVVDSEENESSPSSDENAPRYKQINAWIAEREDAPHTPLVVNETYTLNFNVGDQPAQSNLFASDKAKMPHSDIPDDGLDTEWVVTAKNIKIDGSDSAMCVASASLDLETWTATFFLHVPKSSDSETKQIKITPLAAKDSELHILIFAKNRIYRQFLVELDVRNAEKQTPNSEVGAAGAAKITSEVIHAPAAQINPRPAHEWLTPHGALNITVLRGDAGASVFGEIGWNSINTITAWYGNEKSIAPAIANLRAAAKNFCDDADAYLNDIDPDDLLQRLSATTAHPDSFIFRDNADAAHEKTWSEEISVSDKLRRLAAYGYQLYETIFPRDTDLRQWLDALPPGWRINVSWSEISGSAYVPNIPWGLIYVQPPPAAGQPVDALAFFGLRYRLEYTAYDVRMPKSIALGNRDKTFRANCLYWGKQPNDEAAREAVWQQNQWKGQTNQVFIPADSAAPESNPMDALLKMLDAPEPNPMRFLYLFCHCEVGDGSRPVLRFGSGKQATDLVEQINLGSSQLADQPLVFVNACTSAAGNAYVVNQLVETFFRRGCRAFLGTEIYMPIALASRFALVFNSFFYREIDSAPITAGEAVYQSRLFLWHQYRNVGGIFYTYINEYDLFMADEGEVQFN